MDKLNSPLASWVLTRAEWKRFVRAERRQRVQELLLEMSLILVFGELLLGWLYSAGWVLAFAINLFVAMAYGALKYFHRTVFDRKRRGAPSVRVFEEGVDLNGQWTGWSANGRWRGKVALLDNRKPIVLEITYHWQTRRGPAFDEVRVPVPKGRLGEAVRLVERMRLMKSE